eukprot:jgi/Ulvmu1/3805/UM018_0015.1
MIRYPVFFIAFLGTALYGPQQAAGSGIPRQTEDGVPGMEVAVRQALLDYGVTVGLDALSSHIHDITIKEVDTTISVPLLGQVDLTITNIKCLNFKEPRELAKVEIENSTFSASSNAISAKFEYQWTWKSHSLPLDGDGDGSIAFDSGDVAMKFSVADEGGPQIIVNDASIHFEDIQLEAHGSLSWLYNALLVLFHNSIVSQIEDRMTEALLSDVPAKLNTYLKALPSTVVIRGLPISAAFQYGIYTHGFLMVRAFPTVGTPAMQRPLPAAALSHAATAHAQGSSSAGAASAQQLVQQAGTSAVAVGAAAWTDEGLVHGADGERLAAALHEDPLKRVGHTMVTLFNAAWQQWLPSQQLQLGSPASAGSLLAAGDGMQPVGDGGQRCPSSTVPLNVSNADIASDSHMATLFVNDAVPQCLLWALHKEALLHYTVKDGEVPGVRLLTDVFAVLIPGVQEDYPHRSIALSLDATSEPEVAFLSGKGARFAGSYETRVYVLPADYAVEAAGSTAYATGSGPQVAAAGLPDGSIEVAVLEAELSGVVDLQFKQSKVSDLKVKYTIKDSKYKVSAWAWEATVKYVVGQVQVRVGVEALWDKFVAHGAASKVHAQHTLGVYLPGWFQLAVDFRVDLD